MTTKPQYSAYQLSSFTGSRTSVVATLPSSSAANDFVLLFVQSNVTTSNAGISASGWTLLDRVSGGAVFWARLSNSDVTAGTVTVTFSTAVTSVECIAVRYTGVANGSEIKAHAAVHSTTESDPFPSVTNPDGLTGQIVVCGLQPSQGNVPWGSVDSRLTTRILGRSTTGHAIALADLGSAGYSAGAGASPSYASDSNAGADKLLATVALGSPNSPPNAPTAPSIPSPFNRLQPLTVNPVFSDNDPGDTPSRLYYRYRSATITPTPDWTVGHQDGAGQMLTFPGSTFAADRYEFQFAYQDAQGAPTDTTQLAWSPSVFATGAIPSNAPTITSPTNGAAIGSSSCTVQYSTPAQIDGLRYYVTDAAGNTIIPLTTITDPNQLTARQFTITGLANGSSIKIFAAYHDANGWTSYTESDNTVSYTPPPTPMFTVTTGQPNAAAMLVAITNPAPSGNSPGATSNLIEASTDGGVTVEWSRGAVITVAPNATVPFYVPLSKATYSFRVTAEADNGTTSTTGWVTL